MIHTNNKHTFLKLTVASLMYALLMIILIIISSITTKAVEPIKKGLTISPLRNELNIEPGTSKTSSIIMSNLSDEPMAVMLSAEGFNVINQQYDYVFTSESDVVKWVKYESDSLFLEPGQTKSVNYTVGVPLSTEPGGRYVSLFASTTDNNNDSGFSALRRIASLLYITVEGDVSREGHLITLNSPWAIFDSSKWSATIRNSGSTHFISRYNIKTSSILSGKEYSIIENESLIMPSSVRLISGEIPTPKFPGIYKFEYLIGLGDTPARVEIRYALYLPKYFIWVIVFLTTITLILTIIRKNTQKN